MADQRAHMQSLTDEYQELTTLISARQKLESQQQENASVKKEFKDLDDDAKIYKLVGPVLLKQETSEAKSTVEGRLEYIEKEIKRIEESIKGIQEKSEGKKMQIMQLQNQMQPAQP
ncbi:prefoldin subunit 6 like protein [Zymoseptoria brevis]|uniref:Prefoldin subunit 6 like protein n=1 Tax=Zymoseptoria brevis TaxID=1047168 RepID=A0A0F4GXY5_9PEZI|nr:prefoldin subunit 6 like protein [Zymoseptoria brevis]